MKRKRTYTEDDYARLTTLTRVRIVMDILRDVIPEISPEVGRDEHQHVASVVLAWTHRLEVATGAKAASKEPWLAKVKPFVPYDHLIAVRAAAGSAVDHSSPVYNDAGDRTCLQCGCTDSEACMDGPEPCAWSTEKPALCTRCEDDAAMPRQRRPSTKR